MPLFWCYAQQKQISCILFRRKISNSLCNYVSNEKSANLSAIISSIYHVQCSIAPYITKPVRWTFFRSIVCVVESIMTCQLSFFSILYLLYTFLMVLRTIRRPFEVQERVAMELAKGTKALFTFSSGLCLLSTAVQCLIAFKYQKENVKYGYFLGIFPSKDPNNEPPRESNMKIEIGSNIYSQGGNSPKKVTKWMSFLKQTPIHKASWVCILEFVTF